MGALIALLIFKSQFTIIALIGVILLIGIVKKNAILLIDFAIEAKRDGRLSSEEAIVQACLLRFRPILMTTVAAILGAVPLAFSSGYGAEIRKPLGIAIVGGLIVSQLLTLYTTPCSTCSSTGSADARRARPNPDHRKAGPSMRAIVLSLGLAALPLAALPAPARAEPADALCVYLGFACSTPAPQVPTLLPGPLYLPAGAAAGRVGRARLHLRAGGPALSGLPRRREDLPEPPAPALAAVTGSLASCGVERRCDPLFDRPHFRVPTRHASRSAGLSHGNAYGPPPSRGPSRSDRTRLRGVEVRAAPAFSHSFRRSPRCQPRRVAHSIATLPAEASMAAAFIEHRPKSTDKDAGVSHYVIMVDHAEKHGEFKTQRAAHDKGLQRGLPPRSNRPRPPPAGPGQAGSLAP